MTSVTVDPAAAEAVPLTVIIMFVVIELLQVPKMILLAARLDDRERCRVMGLTEIDAEEKHHCDNFLYRSFRRRKTARGDHA